MAQLMPLPLTVSCFSKIQIVLPFWYRLTRVVLEKGPLNGCVCEGVCVCVCVYWNILTFGLMSVRCFPKLYLLLFCILLNKCSLQVPASVDVTFYMASKSQHQQLTIGLPDLPYFTGDPVFQTPPGRKPPGRTNLPYSVSQIVASLRWHCDTWKLRVKLL